ncbi:hypothetical protein [Caulobacter vibrioides]|uniref:hypothetical protein n=1 Tax=Caulobacter vibrioides TaxID=155892 RepID=UPI000BB4B64A|nr:hypothetical protein [Caulobacter vibrioides]ATC25221.1 hypothetical protein CA608_12115 [Caulobacter vibrioides]ATC26509.1 hypothetical protein CA608_19230 [Caulobacter vibrioides]PLR12331.1 hypothetical protein CVUC_08860 [Caulobacter vibrioides]PLR13991.1 hypothetical protein CVUC_05415 [Caulobacter vibrioides]
MSEERDEEGPYPISGPDQVLMWPKGERAGFGLKVEGGPTILFDCEPSVLDHVIRELQAIKAKADQLAEERPDGPVVVPFPIQTLGLTHDPENDQAYLTLKSAGPAHLGSPVPHDLLAGLFRAIGALLEISPGLKRAVAQLGAAPPTTRRQ